MHFFIPIHAERPENAEFERNKKIIKEGFPTFVLASLTHFSEQTHAKRLVFIEKYASKYV